MRDVLPLGRVGLEVVEEFSVGDAGLDRTDADLGAEQVLVLSYEQFQLDALGFIQAILDFCGIARTREQLASLPHGRKLNPGSSLFGIEKKRLANRLYRNIYNANGLLEETEQRQYQRMADFRKRQEGWLDRALSPMLERRFQRIMATQLKGRFADSNSRSASLAGLDLASQGYQMPASG